MDKIRSGECNINNPDNLIGLNLDLAILSEEESLAKFKEIWDKANESTEDNTHDCPFGIEYSKIEQDWEEFKQTL
jgi:hypothetical protein